MRHLHFMTERKSRQNQRQHHGNGLRRNNDPMAIEAIRGRPSNRRHDKDGDLAGETH